MTTGSFLAGKRGSDIGSLPGLGSLLSLSCTQTCFEGNINFQGPEFPHLLPVSRAASSATQAANAQGKSCCVPVPAPCTPQHLFSFLRQVTNSFKTGRCTGCRPQSNAGYCIKHFHRRGKSPGEDRAGTSSRTGKIKQLAQESHLRKPNL